MQLRPAAGRAGWRAWLKLSPFHRTLLTLCICTAPVLGGVLPEDRLDAM